MLGNKHAVEQAIKEKLGADTVVEHKCGIPFTVVSSIGGNKGKRECLPPYYNNCYNCGCKNCGGQEKTADYAAAIAGGGPAAASMER